MRFLILASVLACAAAVPSGLLAAPYSLPLGPVAQLAPALPTISAGDINGAAIDAHVEASDYVRAAVDKTRQFSDKVNELQGQAINNAEEYAWRSIDSVKTAEAQLDGAAAGVAPILSKQLVGRVAPVVSAAPLVASYGAPYAAPYAAASYGAPVFSGYPAIAPSPYFASPLGYQAW